MRMRMRRWRVRRGERGGRGDEIARRLFSFFGVVTP